MARLTAVDYDPFASGPSLTPVDYDPFAPALNARASGSAGAVNKKAEAIWGGSFDDWKKRKEADDAERARMVAESEAGNVGSRRAQDFQRKVAALNKEGDQTGDYSADSLRAGRSLEMGMEQGREQIGAGLQFAGETPLALADFFGRIRPKGETEQDRSNPVTEAGKDIRGAAVARQQEIAPLMIDRPESLLSVQGAKYIAQSALQSAPTTGTGLAAAVINPAAGLSLMGAGAGSAKFADARAEDKGYWLSAEAGAAAAAAEVVPEMLPLGFLSGRLLKHLPGTAMKRLASSPAGRGALLSLSEGASEGVTELSNIAYEIAREGKTYTDEQIANRLIDATAVGTVMGGGMAAVAEATGQNARAYDQSKIADLELENSLRAAIKPRATTARILGPTATPDAAAGAQIADDAFRAAGVGTVAAADIAEQDALARDLDAAQRDQLGSEAEIDRLLTGNTPRERTDLYRASIPGAIPQGVQVTSNQDAFAAPGTIGGRDAPAPIQVTTLADRSVFVPGDPAAIRQKLADAGSQWQGMAQERDGVAGVRFSPTSWTDVQGLIGGSIAPTANVAPEVAEAPAAAPPLDLTARRTNSDTKFDERVHDLTDFIALNGGLDRSALESEGIDPANWNSRKAKGQNDKFFGKPLFRKTGGMTLETLREKARDAGFRTDKDVLDLISESLGGRKTFTPAGSEYQMALADVARQEADAQARQQRVNALPLSVPETDADAYIASRETEFDAPADRDGADLADIESTLASVADTSPQQRASVVSLGHDYTAKLIELKRARAAGALNPDQQEAYIDLLEQDRETGKVAGRPMVGIGNKSAYVDAQMQGKLMPVQVFLDADNFKALNDKFGHDVGDDVIRLIADVVRAEFGEGNVFHRGGDEFLTQGMTQEEVDAKMARVQDYLARVKMELPLSDGRTATLTGVGVSYGTGANEKAADDSLKQDKQRRKDAGLRFDRREGDDAGRVGSQSSGAGTEASGANSRDSSRAAAEGVGDERQNRTNLPDAGSSREVAGRRGDAERAPDDLGGSGPRTEAVRGGQAGSREVSGGIATVRSAISQALGAKFLRRLESQPWFHLVGTLADLPANIRKSITDGGNVAGFVLGNDVYIIADQASDPVGVTLHEVGVHFGMSGILGADFPAVLRNFKRQRAKDAAVGRAYERATEAAERGEDGELTADALATLDEEALAYYVEANWNAKDTRGIVYKVIDAIKRLLNRLGIPLSTLNASPELLRNVAIGAARKAADGRVSVGKDGALRYHKAWHGSPHDFDKFRLDDSTIGTGEGAQAFGFGLYFAGRKELGEHYRKQLSISQQTLKDLASPYDDAGYSDEEAITKLRRAADVARRNERNGEAADYDETARWIESGRPVNFGGRLYEVELAPTEDQYLDWDAPLSEQSEKVRGVMLPLVADEVSRRNAERERMNALSPGRLTHPVISKLATKVSTADSITGQSAYESLSKKLGGDRQASAALHAAGIPGIRYLDGSSRGGKTGWRVKFKNGQYSGKVFDTKADADAAVERGEYNMVDRVEKIDDLSRNFVIFDDSSVEVKAKYSRRVQDGRIRKTVAELTNAADSMGSWRDWYDRHDQTLRDVFGDDAELFQKLLSATSQAASVPANVGLALKAYRQLFSGEPFTGYLPAVIKNLDRVAASEALRGQKISEYGSASEGNAGAIAVDRHIAMLFFGTKSPNRAQVESAKNRIRAIAERLGWQPREVQAALWAYNQTLLGTAPEDVKSYDKLIEKARARIDALRASIGRGEDRGAREVGGTAGRDGSAERDSAASREQARAEVGPKYSRRADGGSDAGLVHLRKFSGKEIADAGGFEMDPAKVADDGDDGQSPWLMADGKIIGTGQDHIGFAEQLADAPDYSIFMGETGAVRTGMFARRNGDYVVTLHTFEGQEFTPEQIGTLRGIEARRGKITVMHGAANGLVNPEYLEKSIGELPQQRMADGGVNSGTSSPRYSRRTIEVDGTERPSEDSTGKQIHPTEEGIRAFWRWFKDSRVVDDQGRPLVVYHGTSDDVEAFDPARAVSEGGAFYFSNSYPHARAITNANTYARKSGGNVVPAYLKITSPLEDGYLGSVDEKSSSEEIEDFLSGVEKFNRGLDYKKERYFSQLISFAKKMRNDGVIIRNVEDDSADYGSQTPTTVYAVFAPAQVKSALGNSGAFSPTDARIAYSRRTAEPEGLPPPVAIESHLSNMLKLRAFWDSAVDVMARQPGLKPLADAVRSYFDNVRRRQGLVNEVLRAPVKAASKADLDAFERYQYALQNNLRADVSEELAGMTDKGRALVSAWEKVAKLTNDENQKVGVQVFDPKIGGWRKIGTARNFFPRVLKPKFQEAMRQPHKYPAEWNQLVRILLDAGRIQSAEDAQEFLNRSFSNESAFEYFAGIEKARMEPLPRDLYDYSMDAAIGYKDAWADRLSQIEAFGQRIGQGDQAKDKFDEVLLTVTDDNTRNYVTRVRERITNTNSKSPFYKFMANMNTLVTGLMLGNPATAALNIIGGLSNNAMVFPLGPNLKAFKELRHLGSGIRDAVANGVLIDDYMGVSADAAAQGVSERLSNLTQGLLNWGGYNGTEYINRVHSMLVGKHFLSDSLTAINKNPRSRKSLLATAFMQRNGFDVDALAAETMKAADERPETNRFLRFAANLTQGSYKIDQTPIFVDEPIGKFLFKYQKFGTQINRVFYQQMLRPFVQSVFKGGEPVTLKNADGTEAQERVRNFVPLIRFIVGAIPGGMLVQFVREAFFGYGEDGPDEDEIRRKLADGETAAAAAMLAERAFIAITALGAGGFLGNYMQTAKDFQERQRYKNPMDPPGLAPVKSFVNFVMKLNDQGKITMDDVEQEIQNNVSLYRTTKRLLSSGINMVSDESVTFAAREAARREHNHVRYMARRYADSVGIEAKRRAPSEIATTANTPTNRAIKDALLLGDGETARALAAEYVASFDNAYDAANALASIRNSIRLGQPALVQLAPSETERRRFMRWAFSNLTPEGYARIKETDEKYRKAAASSGLWKPESDAAAMKRDRKADESKAQWSESQRNSFLRSKGLKR